MIKVNKIFLLVLLISAGVYACFDFGDTYTKLPPGPWRAILKLDPERSQLQSARHETRVSDNVSFDEVTEGDLPFNFEVIYRDKENFYIEISNAEEKIILDQITFQKDRATNKDTVFIEFPPYDSYFKVIFEDNILEGFWYVPSRVNYQIHFVAKHGHDYRFTTLKKPPVLDLTGKWEITFGVDDTVPVPAIGYFKQNGNHLTGTFQTETGDYRYLEGTVQANKMYLSCFDGSHAYLFEALIREDGSLSGVFRSGIHYVTSWNGKRNEDFQLRDPDSITTMRTEKFAFSFPDDQGKMVSLHDPVYENRPKVIQLMGTWCPNCLDETRFLLDYFSKRNSDIALIALAFERHPNQNMALASISRFKEHLQIDYPILYAGSSNKTEASKQLPMLNQVVSFPTLIFLDRNNQVQRIHTGFAGPATPGYPALIAELEKTLENLENH